MNPGDIGWAIAAGADFVVSARGFMFALGCIQVLRCKRNTCPTGITIHNSRFQKALVVADKKDRVAHYATAIVKKLETIAHSVGVSEPRKLSREHVPLVQPDGKSVPMDELYPSHVR